MLEKEDGSGTAEAAVPSPQSMLAARIGAAPAVHDPVAVTPSGAAPLFGVMLMMQEGACASAAIGSSAQKNRTSQMALPRVIGFGIPRIAQCGEIERSAELPEHCAAAARGCRSQRRSRIHA